MEASQELQPQEPMSDANRGSLLAQRIGHWTGQGWRVEAQTPYSATLAKGHRTNHILHLILTIITAGLWGIVWIIVAITNKEKRRTISVDAYGNVTG